MYTNNSVQLYHADAKDMIRVIPPLSVDLIYTDPPYPKQYLYLYEWLASEAYRALKPDGFLIVYAAPYWKDEVMAQFRQWSTLEYFWDIPMIHPGNTTMIWSRKIISGYKSMLCYRKKNGGMPTTNMLGSWRGTGSDKRFHKWGQDANCARYYIDILSEPGDVVVDYFVGGGTVPDVCQTLHRRCIACDVDEEAIQTTIDRIDGNYIPDNEQQEMFGDSVLNLTKYQSYLGIR